LLDTNKILKKQRIIEENASAENLKKYGFNNNNLKITLTSESAENTIEIGDRIPVDPNYFARIANLQHVFLVDNTYYDAVNLNISQLRKKEIFDIQNITALSIKGEHILELIKKDNLWNIKKPKELLASTIEIQNFIKELNSIKYKEVLTDSKKEAEKYLTTQKNLEIKFLETKENSQIFDVYKNTEQDYIVKSQDSDSIYTITNDDFLKLKKEINILRSKIFFQEKIEDINNIQFLKSNIPELFASKKDKKWILSNTDKTENKKGNNNFEILVAALKSTKIQEFIEKLPEKKLENYKLILSNKIQKIDLEFFVDKDVIYAKKDNEYFKIDNRILTSLERRYKEYVKEDE